MQRLKSWKDARVYFRVVCMWSNGCWYPNTDANGEAIQPVNYHRELEWPIHLGISWTPRAGNFCIDLFFWRVFLSVDPFWRKETSIYASMHQIDREEMEYWRKVISDADRTKIPPPTAKEEKEL